MLINIDIVLPNQRKGDKMVMDILQEELCPYELNIVNKVRIGMKILFISDVVDMQGKNTLPEVYECKLHRTLQLIWPKQVILK